MVCLDFTINIIKIKTKTVKKDVKKDIPNSSKNAVITGTFSFQYEKQSCELTFFQS